LLTPVAKEQLNEGATFNGQAIWAFTATALAQDKMITFSKDSRGKTPPHWTATQTGKGDGSVWKVVEDKTAPSKSGYALAQTAEGSGALFSVCVADGTSFKDLEVPRRKRARRHTDRELFRLDGCGKRPPFFGEQTCS
jgi:hypothetical protein